MSPVCFFCGSEIVNTRINVLELNVAVKQMMKLARVHQWNKYELCFQRREKLYRGVRVSNGEILVVQVTR